MLRLCVALAMVAACGGSQPAASSVRKPAQATTPDTDAVAGVTDPGLRALLADHWDWTLRTSPEWATTLGDHRFDDQVSDPSDAAVRAEAIEVDRFLARARAITAADLGGDDRVTLQLFTEDLEHAVAMRACENHLWNVAANGNPVTRWNYLPEQHPLASSADADHLVARFRKIAGAVDAVIANLRAGAARGLYANQESVRRTLRLVDEQLEKPIEEWALMKPAHGDALDAAHAEAVRAAVTGPIRDAFTRYRDVLRDELLPHARSAEAVGLAGLPIGEACYRASIRNHTGLDLGPRELHELGLAEIERINREMTELGARLFDGADLPTTLARLRTDRALYFRSAEEILEHARESLAAARAAIPTYFGVLPRTECKVAEIPDYEAPYTTIAYYRQPHGDGSKPGEYVVNTFAPETRPRFEAQVLAFHESIPGHHLQIAIAMERSKLPAFRRHGGQTAFVEGWALYTERLADEMGLYRGDLERMGMLSYDAWRAARLVVDTGIHAFGWTRERAEQFMLEHTALAENNIVNEVDRYIGWPGQALAYKVGQLEIRKLRGEAEAALGDHFDIRAFHDVVLSSGGVSLPVLDAQVRAWIRTGGSAR